MRSQKDVPATQSRQNRRGIGGTGCDAIPAAEDRVVTVIAVQRRTLAAALATAVVGVAAGKVIPAPHLLAEVSAQRGHVPVLPRAGGVGSLCKHRIAPAHDRAGLDAAQGGQTADQKAAVIFPNIVQSGLHGLDVDQHAGRNGVHPASQPAQQILPACDQGGLVSVGIEQGHRLGHACRIDMVKTRQAVENGVAARARCRFRRSVGFPQRSPAGFSLAPASSTTR